MDGFPPMPAEIVRLISIEAVRVRGAKRAVRLRLVNRSWNREVMEALFESGISDSFGSLGPVFWPKHLMHKLRQRENLLSRPLRLIRRAAQHVVAFRSGEPNYENHDAVQEYLWEICQLSEDCNVLGPCWPSIFEVPEQMDPIQDSDEDFKQTLLAAAAATNDLALVRELLPLMQGCVHLIYGRDRQEPVLGFPLDIAAFQGHVEMLRMLLGAIQDPVVLGDAYDDGIKLACAGNQLNTLELCLARAYENHWPDPVDLLEGTTSIPVFDAVFQACKDHLILDRHYPWKPNPDKIGMRRQFLSDHFRLSTDYGHLAMVKHLVQLGAPARHIERCDDNEFGFHTVVSYAATSGNAELLAYLLENGTQIGSRSLEAASKHGNPDCVRILLEHGANDNFKLGGALLESVKGENESVLRLLLESVTPVDEDLRRQALAFAGKEGLVSMTRVLEEYK